MRKIFFFLFILISNCLMAVDAMRFDLVTGKEIKYQPDSSYIEVYLPSRSNGRAVIICPGGAYGYEEMDKEGREWAPWFNSHGIAAIILNYRLPKGNVSIPLADVNKAMDVVYSHALEWNINVSNIGIMGSSAGGHLAATLATHCDSKHKPAFQILMYPVISMDPSITHKGSHDNLLGKSATKELEDRYSNELHVSTDTPPAFIVLCEDDRIVSPENSLRYYSALTKAQVPSEIHIYAHGGHGFGCRLGFYYIEQMLDSLHLWLNNLELAK